MHLPADVFHIHKGEHVCCLPWSWYEYAMIEGTRSFLTSHVDAGNSIQDGFWVPPVQIKYVFEMSPSPPSRNISAIVFVIVYMFCSMQ